MLKVAILSAWLILTPVMWFAATKSFSTVDRVLGTANIQFDEATKGMAEGQTRVVLRHLASEINRSFFWGYGLAQIVLGGALVLLLWRDNPTRCSRLRSGLLHAGPGPDPHAGVTPMIVSLGTKHRFCSPQPTPTRHAALLGVARSFHRAWMA